MATILILGTGIVVVWGGFSLVLIIATQRLERRTKRANREIVVLTGAINEELAIKRARKILA